MTANKDDQLHIFDVADRMMTLCRFVLATFLLMALASCQSGNPEDLMDAAVEPQNVQAGEVFGSGPTRISMLMHRSGQAYDQKLSIAYYNGAKLAVQDLGAETVTVAIEDSASLSSRIKQQVSAASASQLLILPGDAASVEAAMSASVGSNRPAIALGPYQGKSQASAYWFLPSTSDELAAAAEYVSRLLKKDVSALVLVPRLAEANALNDLTSRIGKYTKTLELARYEPGKGFASIGSRDKEALSRANTVFVVGNDPTMITLLDELRKSKQAAGVKTFVVEAELIRAFASNAAMNGVIAAIPDNSNLDIVRDRYDKVYGAAMPIEAAYAYDAIAIAAGLARAKGESGLSKENLENSRGFKASTGSFRFRPDGKVERLFRMIRVADGNVETIEKAAAGF